MYGDTAVMRKRVSQLRDQGTDIRALADHLVGQAEQVTWTGRAADAMRARVRERAAHLRDSATRHDSAADALDRHLQEIDHAQDVIAQRERAVTSLVDDGAAPPDFIPPPSGHRDWLTLEIPGR